MLKVITKDNEFLIPKTVIRFINLGENKIYFDDNTIYKYSDILWIDDGSWVSIINDYYPIDYVG